MIADEESKETKEKDNPLNQQGTGTEYDDAFRTLCIDCSSLLLPVLNEVFGEHYRGDEKVRFAANEKFIERPGGGTDKRITDSDFKVGNTGYHLEAESSENDRSMLLRLFEYDTQIALRDAEIKGNEMRVRFPRAAVLQMRHNSNTPDYMRLIIGTHESECEYTIPLMKIGNYSLDDVFEKELYILIPFYIFKHEKEFGTIDQEAEGTGIEKLKTEYMTIFDKLEELRDEGRINNLTYNCILDMSKKVLNKISANYDNVREGVKSVMGGKVLDYPGRKEYYEGMEKGIETGIEQGREQGIEQGIEQGDTLRIRKSIKRMVEVKGLTYEEACDYLDVDPDDYRDLETA